VVRRTYDFIHVFKINPATEEPIETFSYFTSKETEALLTRADKTFQPFRFSRSFFQKLTGGDYFAHCRATLLPELLDPVSEKIAEVPIDAGFRRCSEITDSRFAADDGQTSNISFLT
jgi:hypothetical protein